ncbi:MAG TPA: hypothetical protein VGS57_10735 [Thermoanaerobaculia bacterium]|jgi:hypothetical protein|nr:hypothetical protein [Thermoanaerobaculia bacterium]
MNDGARPVPPASSARYVVAAVLALVGGLLAGSALGLLLLAMDRRYAAGWQIGAGVVIAAGFVLVLAAVWLARLQPRRALMAFLGATLLVPAVARTLHTHVGSATSYAPAKSTITEIRELGVALESRAVDENGYPAVATVDELAPLLEGHYLRAVPRLDGWQRALRYEVDGSGPDARYFIASAGSDGLWKHSRLADYRDSPGPHGDDIVYSNGGFVTLPGR